MSVRTGTVEDYCDRLLRKAPEYLDLLAAETEDEFERAFIPILERTLTELEQNSRSFKSLDEVALSAILKIGLTIPGLTVMQEAHSNGHVDLTIEADHCSPIRRKLAEAKIYDGPAYHVNGLEQLLGRYTTGREGRGLLIEYFKCAGIARLVKKLRNKMDNERPLKQRGPTEDHLLKWSFITAHRHSCGEDVQVGHVGCNLHCSD